MAIIINKNGVNLSIANSTPSNPSSSRSSLNYALSKVPEVTLLFWLIKIASTTLGETAGDTLSMSLNLGYLLSTVIFVIAVATQIKADLFSKWLYWTTIIATTTLGTTIADFVTRSNGGLALSRFGTSAALLAFIVLCLVLFKQRASSKAH